MKMVETYRAMLVDTETFMLASEEWRESLVPQVTQIAPRSYNAVVLSDVDDEYELEEDGEE
jgi:hypothetical protein